jgi:hypothetical protein
MLLLQKHSLTILAVVITTPKSVVPDVVTIGLAVISVIAIAVTLVEAFRRNNVPLQRETSRESFEESGNSNTHPERMRKLKVG